MCHTFGTTWTLILYPGFPGSDSVHPKLDLSANQSTLSWLCRKISLPSVGFVGTSVHPQLALSANQSTLSWLCRQISPETWHIEVVVEAPLDIFGLGFHLYFSLLPHIVFGAFRAYGRNSGTWYRGWTDLPTQPT